MAFESKSPAEMDHEAAIAEKDLEQMVLNKQEPIPFEDAIKIIGEWFLKYRMGAGYKRLSKVIMSYVR